MKWSLGCAVEAFLAQKKADNHGQGRVIVSRNAMLILSIKAYSLSRLLTIIAFSK